MKDAIDIGAMVIHDSPDVRGWPATAAITRLELLDDRTDVAFTKRTGPSRWPDVIPAGWDGPLQFTLWIIVKIGDMWHGAGIVQFWNDRVDTGDDVGSDHQIAKNWLYDQRWGVMQGYDPRPGEQVGFMVTAGNARGGLDALVLERSNIVLVPFPGDTGQAYDFPAQGADPQPGEPPAPAPPVPDPTPTPGTGTGSGSDIIAKFMARFDALEAKLDAQSDHLLVVEGELKAQIAALSFTGTVKTSAFGGSNPITLTQPKK